MQYSIVNFYDLEKISLRLDADYYRPDYLLEDTQRRKIQNVKLSQIAFITDGQHGYHEIDETSSIIMLTAKNAKNWFTDNNNAEHIAQWVDDKNKRSSLKINDVVLSTRGSIGYCAIVTGEVLPANIDQDIARIALLDNSLVTPQYLLAYLNSRFGYDWMIRNASGMVQLGIPIDKVKSIPIPILKGAFQKFISIIIIEAYQQRINSQRLYCEAEEILLNELGLLDWQPKHEPSFVQQFSKADEAKRWDADYHQPKYTMMIKHLNTMPHETLDQVASFSNGATPLGANYPETGIPFLRIQNVGNNRLILDDVVHIDRSIHNSQLKRSQLASGDVLITITGRIGTSAVVPDDLPEANINQHIVRLRLRNKDFLPHYLAVFLNSLAGRLQTEREAYGTTRDALPYYCLNRIIIPKVELHIQDKITKKILVAQQTDQIANQLLEIAKHAVEIAIEQDETIAEVWLRDQTRTLGVNIDS